MDIILHCLRKNCFDSDEEQDNRTDNAPENLLVEREDVSTLYQPPSPTGSHDGDDYANTHGEFIVDFAAMGREYDTDDDSRNQEEEDLIRNNNRKSSQHMNSFFHFLQNLGNPRSDGAGGDDERGINRSEGDTIQTDANSKDSHLLFNPPLKEAQTSIASTKDDIPTIALTEVVMPGSDLQKKMALALKDQGYAGESEEDECVICMEGFDESNPRMPTLCGCGANKTYFHLPCLYHWIEQSRDCPSCRKKLTWQEF